MRIIKILIILSAMALFGWTAWQNAVPSGVLLADYNFDKVSPFITSLLPGDRALAITRDASGTAYQPVIDEPVYFRLKSPRQFERASVEIRFQNNSQPILELGGLANLNPDIYDLKPLENKIIDNLSWPRLAHDGLTLYQRDSKYKTVDEFLSNLPARSEIATYNARVETPFRLPNYTPDERVQTLDYSLRGSHIFYAYIKNESLDVKFFVQEMNRDAGGDPISITVWSDGAPVGTVSEPDDGRVGENEEAGFVHPLALTIPDLPEGAYRIEFRSSRDVFIRKIETRSKKFVIANEIFLGDEAGYRDQDRPITLWTTGRLVRAETLHADGAQELTVGNEILRIPESHKSYQKKISGLPPARLYSPQGDLILRTNGVFALSREALFMPEPIRLSWDTDLDVEGINYILARYEPPKSDGDWKVASANFEFAKLMPENHAFRFAISAPGLADLQNEVRVSNIKVRFERPPQSILSIINQLWQKFAASFQK